MTRYRKGTEFWDAGLLKVGEAAGLEAFKKLKKILKKKDLDNIEKSRKLFKNKFTFGYSCCSLCKE